MDFCAQTLREISASKRILQDLERGQRNMGGSESASHSEQHLAAASEGNTNNIFKLDRFPLQRSALEDPVRRQLIEEIWDKVEPFPLGLLMQRVEAHTTKDDQQPQNFRGDGSATLEEFFSRYPAWNKALAKEPHWHRAFIHFLKHRMSQMAPLHQQFTTKILPYCWNFLLNIMEEERLGSLLSGCYKRGLFRQPKNLDLPDDLQVMLIQIEQLVACFTLLSDTYRLCNLSDDHLTNQLYWFSLVEFKIRGTLTKRKSIQEVLGLRVSKLLQLLHTTQGENTDLVGATGNTFRSDDLNIKYLTLIGNLSLVWTDVLEDHLKLDLLNMTLAAMKDSLSTGWENSLHEWHRLYVQIMFQKNLNQPS